MKMTGTSDTCWSVPSFGRRQSLVVLHNIQGLVKRVGLPGPDRSLDVLQFAVGDLCDHVTLNELRCVILREQAEVKSRVAEIRHFWERGRMTDVDAAALCVVLVRVDEFTAGSASFTVGALQAQTVCDTLTSCICKQEVDVPTCDVE